MPSIICEIISGLGGDCPRRFIACELSTWRRRTRVTLNSLNEWAEVRSKDLNPSRLFLSLDWRHRLTYFSASFRGKPKRTEQIGWIWWIWWGVRVAANGTWSEWPNVALHYKMECGGSSFILGIFCVD
jgi:hypothetical protein